MGLGREHVWGGGGGGARAGTKLVAVAACHHVLLTFLVFPAPAPVLFCLRQKAPPRGILAGSMPLWQFVSAARQCDVHLRQTRGRLLNPEARLVVWLCSTHMHTYAHPHTPARPPARPHRRTPQSQCATYFPAVAPSSSLLSAARKCSAPEGSFRFLCGCDSYTGSASVADLAPIAYLDGANAISAWWAHTFSLSLSLSSSLSLFPSISLFRSLPSSSSTSST